MKPEQFIQALRKNTHTKKDGWWIILQAIKTLKLEKHILKKINPLLLSPNIKESDIKNMIS